jgi:hypothetical protein
MALSWNVKNVTVVIILYELKLMCVIYRVIKCLCAPDDYATHSTLKPVPTLPR